MSTRRRIDVSVAFLGVTLAAGLAGCGGAAQETLPTGEVKIVPPLNPKGDAGPVTEEYKSLSPSGKAKN